MRRVCCLLFTVLLLTSCAGSQLGAKRLINSSPAPVEVKPVAPVEWTLSNGLRVLFVEDRELPLVSGGLYVRGGSLQQSDNELAVYSAMGSQMRQGGTSALSADQLDRLLEELSASVGTDVGEEFGSGSFFCLAEDFEKVFGLFGDVLRRPRFQKDRLDLWKGQSIDGIKRRKENPHNVGSISFRQLLYGSSAYGRVAVSKDISKISRLALLRAHRKLFRPNGSILVVTGSIGSSELKGAVEREFGDWERSGPDEFEIPPLDFVPKAGVYFVDRPFEQSTIIMGQLGAPRHSPDQYRIRVFNEIFGSSGFGSRLMKRVRAELGLTYGAYGAVTEGVRLGKSIIFLQTKAPTTGEAVSESIDVLRKMQSEFVTQTELDRVKSAVQNGFVFKFDQPGKAASRKATLDLLGYPEDYDLTFVPNILDIQAADVLKIAQERWDVNKFVIVVVGNETAFQSLQSLKESGYPPLAEMDFKRLTFDERLNLDG